MHISPTLSVYIGRNFLFWIAVVLSGLLITVLLFDTIELLRRAAGRPAASFEVVVTMALLRLPELAQQLMPFVLLFATMLTFWRLTRSHELTVVRAAGVSVWQFLFPAVTLALVVGAVTLIFGAIGYLMVLAGWPRAPFVLGLVLGKITENYLYISTARYEAAWLTRPVVMVLMAIAIAVILYPMFQARRKAAARA